MSCGIIWFIRSRFEDFSLRCVSFVWDGQRESTWRRTIYSVWGYWINWHKMDTEYGCFQFLRMGNIVFASCNKLQVSLNVHLRPVDLKISLLVYIMYLILCCSRQDRSFTPEKYLSSSVMFIRSCRSAEFKLCVSHCYASLFWCRLYKHIHDSK